MEHHRPKRRADLAIALVGIVTAIVSLGPWRFHDPDTEASSAGESAAWERFSERCASDSLRTQTEAEADFRANDRDWCNVNDFWTSGVGLYTMTSSSVSPAESELQTIKLIELSIASADEQEESPD